MGLLRNDKIGNKNKLKEFSKAEGESGQCSVGSFQLSVFSLQLSVVSGQLAVVSGQCSELSWQCSVVSVQLAVAVGNKQKKENFSSTSLFLTNQQQTVFAFVFYWGSVNARGHLLCWMVYRQAPKLS